MPEVGIRSEPTHRNSSTPAGASTPSRATLPAAADTAEYGRDLSGGHLPLAPSPNPELTHPRAVPHPIGLARRAGEDRKATDHVEDVRHRGARAAARRAALACLCRVVLRWSQWQAEHPSRERAAPGVTTHAWTRTTGAAHREEPGPGGSRHFGQQLNHADLAQPEEQPSPKRQVGGSKPSVRAKYRSTLHGAPGGNGAHCHKAHAGAVQTTQQRAPSRCGAGSQRTNVRPATAMRPGPTLG